MEWLYKKSKKGDKLQVWALEAEGNKFRSHEGYEGGTITIGEWTTCEGKNIGKKNETTPETQARLEVASRYQKKIDKGYSPDKDNCERPFEVTLAYGFKDYLDNITYPVLTSPKLDGIRCYYRNGKLYSRQNKEILSCPHVAKELDKFPFWKDKIVDGELYSHDLKDNFDKIVSLVRKTKPTSEDLRDSKDFIKFNIFDFVSDDPYTDRYELMQTMKPKGNDILTIVGHFYARSEEDILNNHNTYVSWGYEGTMIRWGDIPYHKGRTKYLLKMKDFDEDEFPVIGMLDGRGKDANTLSKWVVLLPNGNECEVNTTGTAEENLKYWLDKENLIGKVKITVKYQGYTPKGRLRFATFKAIRNYE